MKLYICTNTASGDNLDMHVLAKDEREAVRLIGRTYEVTRYDCDNKQWRVWELPFGPTTMQTKSKVLLWPDDVKIPSTVLPTSY